MRWCNTRTEALRLLGVLLLVVGISAAFGETPEDRQVELPVKGISKTEAFGRIVLNIREDGTITVGENLVIAGEEAVVEYVNRERRRLLAEGLSARLYLRADRNSAFKYTRDVIRWASHAGVDEVTLGAFKEVAQRPGVRVEKGEAALHETLDDEKDIPPKVGEEATVVVEVFVDAEGGVFLANEEEMLNTNATDRELRLLWLKLKNIAEEEGVEKRELEISLRIDAHTSQQRVIDVLNSFAGMGISNVTLSKSKSKSKSKENAD